MKLTERTLMPAASTNDDVIHLVDVSDTSGGADGTSYKAKRSQIASQTFADDAARAAAVPGFIGQLGIQLDTGFQYRSTGILAGNWTELTNSGTYTPTISSHNCLYAYTIYSFNYQKIGDIVFCSGRMVLNFTSGGFIAFNPPILPGSAFSTQFKVNGGISGYTLGAVSGVLEAATTTTNIAANFLVDAGALGTNLDVGFWFSYTVV